MAKNSASKQAKARRNALASRKPLNTDALAATLVRRGLASDWAIDHRVKHAASKSGRKPAQ